MVNGEGCIHVISADLVNNELSVEYISSIKGIPGCINSVEGGKQFTSTLNLVNRRFLWGGIIVLARLTDRSYKGSKHGSKNILFTASGVQDSQSNDKIICILSRLTCLPCLVSGWFIMTVYLGHLCAKTSVKECRLVSDS